MVDCTELPHCSLAQASSHKAHRLSGKLGRGGNNGGWFYGEQLLLSASATGVIQGWLVGLASIDDRWMMEAFLSSRQEAMQIIGPALPKKKRYQIQKLPAMESFSPALSVGQASTRPYLADKGFNGERWISHWREFYEALVITAPPANVKTDFSLADEKWLSSHRQIIETVFARLTEVFGLKRLNAHSDWGKITRLAAKTAAYNLGIFFNRLLKRPDGALATLIQ